MTIPRIASYSLADFDRPVEGKVNWTVDPARAVLLIHDMQRYFMAFYGEDSPLAHELTGNIRRLKDRCAALGIPVVYTAQPTEQSAADRALLNDMWGPGLTTADPASAAIMTDIAPDADDLVLTKWRYSAFQRSPLQDRMRQWGRDQLLICGVYAHIGCLTTALDAFMRDIQPFMVADALADFSPEEHRMALDYVAKRCGRVMRMGDFMGDAPLTREALLARLSLMIEDSDETIGWDDNLIDFGLDSVRVMELVADWKAAGIALDFEDLARVPTPARWWSLVEAQLPANATLTPA
jgi:bifunctional isochorismate lyase/aryl carrier protein